VTDTEALPAAGMDTVLAGAVPVRDEDELTALIGEPLPRVRDKVRTHLHELDVAWLRASPFCLVATSGVDGRCDVSPKGDPPGSLAYVLGPTTIALAERPGNRRADGYRNILRNPHVGTVFFLPGRGDTLRVNGRAHLVSAAPFFDSMQVKGKRPLLALVVEIEEVFYHCAKAFLRSELWDPSTWRPEAVPSRAEIAKVVDADERSLAELIAYYGPDYGKQLY
jgi:PPOX class probable FMN-dependent enzyme